MSAPYVIDASVYIARFRYSEPGYREAVSFLQRVDAEQWQVYLPAIIRPEISGNIARSTGKLTLVRRVLAILQEPYIEIVAVDEPVGVLAADLAAQYRIRGCDSVYVAVALLRNGVLITLDQEQRQRVPPTLVARTPAEELAQLPP